MADTQPQHAKSVTNEYHPVLGHWLRRLWNRWHLPVSHRRYRAVSQEADDAWLQLSDCCREVRELRRRLGILPAHNDGRDGA